MGSRELAIVVVAAVGVASLASGSAVAGTGAVAASPGTHVWGTAMKVPGTATLNRGGNANVTSVSCASPGNCGAGGIYRDGTRHFQAFVVSQVSGTWHTAIEVPGTAALNQGGDASITSVSCASAGNCSAGGFYGDGFGRQAFVVGQTHGTWHAAIEVPGTAALNQGLAAEINSVSCASAGNCGAGGSYTDGSGHAQASVVSQVSGTWHPAIEVPGTAALNQGGSAEVSSMSCALAGRCSAGGRYTNIFGRVQAFVDSET